MSLIDHHALRTLIKGRKDTWLVTGAGGFIGSHLAANLLELGQDVIALDNLSTGSRENIDFLFSVERSQKEKRGEKDAGSFSFFQYDIADYAKIKDVFEGVDVVLHQAALGSVPRSIEKPQDSHEANVTGFVNVLDAARNAGIKRVVYASSSSVYGDAPTLPKVEAEIGAVLSPYAATKRCNEVYSESYSRCYDLTLVGMRYFNVFGPRQDPEGPYAAVIPRWVAAMQKAEPCLIYGDGTTSRDFCYIDNVVMANLLAALSPELEVGSYVFNVACGDRTSLTELHGLLANAVKSELKLESMPEAEYHDFRVGDVKHSLADISYIEKTLNYCSIVGVQEGIQKTVASFLEKDKQS